MTPARHLKICRITRIVSAIIGLIMILPIIYSGVAGEASMIKTILFISGVIIVFLPYSLSSQGASGQCQKCGGKSFMREAYLQKDQADSNKKTRRSVRIPVPVRELQSCRKTACELHRLSV